MHFFFPGTVSTLPDGRSRVFCESSLHVDLSTKLYKNLKIFEKISDFRKNQHFFFAKIRKFRKNFAIFCDFLQNFATFSKNQLDSFVDLEKPEKMRIWLQNFVSIQPRTSLEKSDVSWLSSRAGTRATASMPWSSSSATGPSRSDLKVARHVGMRAGKLRVKMKVKLARSRLYRCLR